MRLIPLFDGELEFDEESEVGFATYGDDGDWFGYVAGGGRVTGERLSGGLRWANHPRRRADGVWLPDLRGVISTEDGVQILFSLRGYNYGLTDAYEYQRRAAVGGLNMVTPDERYRWVNTMFAVLEADVRPSAEPEHWKVRAFECVNEIVGE